MSFEPKTDVVLPELLPFFCRPIVLGARGRNFRRFPVASINWRRLAKVEFALPPLEEQRRTAGSDRRLTRSTTNRRPPKQG